MYTYEFVWCCCYVKVWLFFIDEEGIGYPNVLDKFGTNGERFNTLSFSECQPRVSPELPKVEIQSEILVKIFDYYTYCRTRQISAQYMHVWDRIFG